MTNSRELLSREAEDHIQPLETAMQEIIQAWQGGTLPESSRLQSIYAPLGGGKSWLLHRWHNRWQGVLLDLKEEHRGTTVARLRQMRKKLEDAPEQRILFLDNVPAAEDELTKAFEEEVLLNELASGNLVIQAQVRSHQACWGGGIPHPPAHLIPPLSPEGVKALRNKFGLSPNLDETETALFSQQETLPGLVRAWYEGRKQRKKDVDILRDYLQTWWQQHDEGVPQNFSQRLLPLAALACRNTFEQKSFLAALSALQRATLSENHISFSENGMFFRLKMKRLEWMQPDGSWYRPVQTVLKTWLLLYNPNVYSCLTSN